MCNNPNFQLESKQLLQDKLSVISTSNNMFGRSIWDKLPDCIFGNFETALVKREQFETFKNHEGDLSPK